MRRILYALTGLMALALIVAIAIQFDPRPSFDPVRYAREAAELDRIAAQQARQQALEPLELGLAVIWRVGALVAFGGVCWWLWSLASLHIDSRRIRLAYSLPDEAGRLPIHLADEGTARDALAAYHVTQLAAAQRPQLHTLNYAPRYTGGSSTITPELCPASPVAVPSFANLLDAGKIGRGPDGRALPIILGVDARTGAELAGSWLDLYSCAVGGLSGSGKTSTSVYLLAQAALHGSRLVLLDPHAGNAESLASRLAPLSSSMICRPAESPREMRDSLDLVADELARRSAPGAGYVRGSAPIVFVADEFAALQRGELAEPLAELVESLGTEGRKFDIYGLICSQVWSSGRAGGTPLRDSLASAYMHRLRPAQARMLSGLTAADLPDDLLSLPAGRAYMLSTSGELRPVAIPHVADTDMARVAAMLTPSVTPSNTPAPVRRIGFRTVAPEGASEGAPEGVGRSPLQAHQEAVNLTPEEARIVAAFLAGTTVSDLAAELAGGKRSGAGYIEASRRVAEILRTALRGQQ